MLGVGTIGRIGGARRRALALPPADPNIEIGANIATSGSGLSNATTITITHTVPANANRLLLVSVSVPIAANYGSVTGVTFNGVALTRLFIDERTESTSRTLLELWYLVSPPIVSSANLVLTRAPASGFEATNFRTSIVAMNMAHAAQEAPSLLGVAYSATGAATYSQSFTTANAWSRLVQLASIELISGTGTTAALDAPVTQHGVSRGTNATAVGLLGSVDCDVAGARSLGVTITGTNARRGHFAAVEVKAVTPSVFQNIYYVANSGDDANSGESEALPLRTPTKAAAAMAGGGEIRFRAGERHRPQSFAAPRTMVSFTGSGTSSNPIRLRSYGTGARPIIDGSVLTPTGWSGATSTDVHGSGHHASIDKRTMSPAVYRTAFPAYGDKMCFPAQWPVPSAIDSIDHSDPTSDAYHQYGVGTHHGLWDGNPATLADQRVAYTGGSSPYAIVIRDARIGTRYGSASLVGYVLACRTNANWTDFRRIVSHDTTNNIITTEATATLGALPFPPDAVNNFYWSIQFHPRDIAQEGQYAFGAFDGSNNITEILAWFGGGDRSVAHCDIGINLGTSNWVDIDGVDFERYAADTTQSTMRASGIIVPTGTANPADDITIRNVAVRQCYDPTRSSAIAFFAQTGHASDRVTIEDVEIGDSWTQSGIRANNLGSSTIARIRSGDLGRTGVYFASANGNTVTDANLSDKFSAHGNGGTNYITTTNNSFIRCLFMNHSNSLTSQTTLASGTSKACVYRDFVATGRRRGDGAIDSAWVCRFDGGDVDSIVERFVTALGNSGGMLLNSAEGPNTGMVIRRGVIQGLGESGTGLNGVTLDRVLITGTLGSLTTISAIQARGATVTNCEIDASAGQSWSGSLTEKMWRYLTWASGAPGSEVYEGVTLGPNFLGWLIPAYNAPRTLVDLTLTRTRVRPGHQAGKTIGCVIRPMPGSTLSLPAGLGNNDLFGLDRGYVYPLANLVAGTHTIVLRETLAAATNGPTRDTSITITAAL